MKYKEIDILLGHHKWRWFLQCIKNSIWRGHSRSFNS